MWKVYTVQMLHKIEGANKQGVYQLYDYGFSTLEQYGIAPESTTRTRGALLCRTAEYGLLLLREFRGSEKKLLCQQELLLHLEEKGHKVDTFLKNKEGELVSRDKDGISYTLRKWYDGRECDTRSEEEILRSVRALAGLHKSMYLPLPELYQERSLLEEYLRHNRELRKIRKFIRNKGAATAFEKDYLEHVQWFLDKGERAVELLETSGYENLRKQAALEGQCCHGEFNQHNVLMLGDTEAVTNFGHWCCGSQVGDLYGFMRKMLEKCGWKQELARNMVRAYHQIRPLSRAEWENLRVRFLYPEKYWKLANYYYSHNKSWISEKNTQKQRNLIEQKKQWEEFQEKCFENNTPDFIAKR